MLEENKKDKYRATLEDVWGDKEYLYTYADSFEKAKSNLDYQKSQRKELKMFGIKKIEKELVKEEIEEVEETEKEIIKKFNSEDFKEYYVSNKGKAYSVKNDELVEMKLGKNGDRLCLTLKTKEGNSTTMNMDSLVWRTFKNDNGKRMKLEHIDKNMNNNALSNLRKVKEEKQVNTNKLENELKKLNKEELIDLINRVYR